MFEIFLEGMNANNLLISFFGIYWMS